jgi:hypothetical protein
LLPRPKGHSRQADVGGRRWLRMALMNPLTDLATVDRLLDRIEAIAASQG